MLTNPLTSEMINKLRGSGESIEIKLNLEDLWSANTHNHDIDNISMLHVICRSIRESNPNQIVIGGQYMIDRLSILIDEDGDAYGTVYDQNGNRVGNLLLSHFKRTWK